MLHNPPTLKEQLFKLCKSEYLENFNEYVRRKEITRYRKIRLNNNISTRSVFLSLLLTGLNLLQRHEVSDKMLYYQ